MVITIKNLIKMYIDKLSKEDIEKYIKSNYNNVSNNDINVIYKYIKTRWLDIYNNDNNIWNDLKKEVNINTYNEAVKLFKKYEHLKTK